MKKEDLIKLGLTEDQANAALAIHGKDIEAHKTRLNTLAQENEALLNQVTEASSTIEGFKQLDIDGIKAAADQYKTKAELAEEELARAREETEEMLAEMEFNQALRDALIQANARNPVAVSALLDYDKLDVDDDGNITGLDKQIEAIKAENSFLFTPDGDNPQIITGSHSSSVLGDTIVEAARAAAGLKSKEN